MLRLVGGERRARRRLPGVGAAAGLTTIEREPVETEAVAFVADTMNTAVPEAVGVPESSPPEVRVSPAGRLPEATTKTGAG